MANASEAQDFTNRSIPTHIVAMQGMLLFLAFKRQR